MEYRNKQAVKAVAKKEETIAAKNEESNRKGGNNNQKVEEEIVSLIEDITGSKVDCMDEDMSALGMTSMQYALFATRVNDRFDTDLNKTYFEDVESINGIIEIVEGKLE